MTPTNARTPNSERQLTTRIAERLGRIDGVAAVALGGSWARDQAHPDSDIDLGIYYHPERRPAIAALRALAAELDDRGDAGTVTNFGEWGPWVNGGAWLRIEGRKVDWLYRDLAVVRRTIDECRAGQTSVTYTPGHPHGFHNHMYLGEVHYCQPLHDPGEELAALKRLTTEYPPLLKRALIDKHLWEAKFALDTAEKSAARGDVFHVAGSLFRCAACLIQALFALNEQYFVNEKGSVRTVESFALHPAGFEETVSAVLAHPGSDPEELSASIRRFDELARAARALSAKVHGRVS